MQLCRLKGIVGALEDWWCGRKILWGTVNLLLVNSKQVQKECEAFGINMRERCVSDPNSIKKWCCGNDKC